MKLASLVKELRIDEPEEFRIASFDPADTRGLDKGKQEKSQLEKRIAQAGTSDQLVREARRLGLVKPGERLFIVKGISAWRKTH